MIIRGCLKTGVYYSHYECFGHTSRVIAVSEVFKKRFPKGSLFFIQAGVQQPKAKIDPLGRVYSLPGAFMNRRNFRQPIREAGVDAEKRAQACVEIVTKEKPELFITEFFPLGREEFRHELIPSLVKLSHQGTALWAVAGYPLLTGVNYEWRQKILKLYQKIIIFSPSLEKDLIAKSFSRAQDKQKYLDFFERNSKKVIFAGYHLPQQPVVDDDEDYNFPRGNIPKNVCRVAVLRGGGAYYPKVIAEAIRASDSLGKEYFLTVVAGPSTMPQEWDLFTKLVGNKKINNLALYRSVGNYEGLIKESDLCVSVAGYHTSVMLLKHRKKAVVIPFEGYGSMSFYEQPARAVMLKEMIGAEVLSIQDLTAKSLSSAIKNIAACPQVSTQVPQEWFMGGNVLDKSLIGLFGR
ncbi:MAG: glycosyltransferase [Candidatus Omnitrophota bacterium]